ncbi:helix-turn-helix domain-containing protein [Pusillimonas sp. SM2304]|uniref:IclR family transcriptional regulator n=1 Tax=Pusillimonas sp. SM2304 TaxID=3073241 RepID=UPI002874DF7A|nr:helix-turn-helix domain-containing protein [Pusillimonas sp. SM2304]MDS1140111.1 helix-turn-helix domain-containing protein [Pusillimonas sp. SM2304]
MNLDPKQTQGAQAVHRALNILSLLSKSHETGIRLAEIVQVSGLDRGTAYRILKALIREGFAIRSDTKHYHLGVEAMHIGLSAMTRAPLIGSVLPAMKSISRITGDTTYLVIRNGDFAHAIHKEQGEFPLRISPTDLLGFLLLGLGTAGQALLATLDAEEIETLFRKHHKSYEIKGISALHLLEIAQRTHARGYSMTDSAVTSGVAGVGVAFSVATGSYAALSTVATSNRIPPQRAPEIAMLVRSHLEAAGFIVHAGPSDRQG